MPPDQRASTADALAVLANGDVELRGRMPWSSNATFLARVTVPEEGIELPAVYKPGLGERPLSDFPQGLFHREAAAYALSEALGWGIVPETVTRTDGPLGPGSLQRFVPADFSQHYFTLLEQPEHHQALRTIAAFDLVANNADRKSGHCLLGREGRVWAIDNGLCFHALPHLRTVIWDFAGEAIPEALLADLERLASGRADLSCLDQHLSPAEAHAVRKRASATVERGSFPEPERTHRAYPWPLV
ncbi:MAG TPA: SCO1664 family protein [bacterium]|nr:SCO1664 family protein [bacterium]